MPMPVCTGQWAVMIVIAVICLAMIRANNFRQQKGCHLPALLWHRPVCWLAFARAGLSFSVKRISFVSAVYTPMTETFNSLSFWISSSPVTTVPDSFRDSFRDSFPLCSVSFFTRIVRPPVVHHSVTIRDLIVETISKQKVFKFFWISSCSFRCSFFYSILVHFHPILFIFTWFSFIFWSFLVLTLILDRFVLVCLSWSDALSSLGIPGLVTSTNCMM